MHLLISQVKEASITCMVLRLNQHSILSTLHIKMVGPKLSSTTLSDNSNHSRVRDHLLHLLILLSLADQHQLKQEKANRALSRKKAEVLDTLEMKTTRSRR